VVYVNSFNILPQINGSESYQLFDDSSTSIDGQTIALVSGQSVKRLAADADAGLEASWVREDETTASPGTAATTAADVGPVISEFSDAPGGGNQEYQFVEIFCDSL